MISDDMILTPRLTRALDALERVGPRFLSMPEMIEAIYPTPTVKPFSAANVVKVTICQIRKPLAGSEWKIETQYGRGYRLTRRE